MSPAELRRALGLLPGTEVVIDVAGGELRLRPRQSDVRQAIERAQSIVRRHVGPETSLAEQLINERRVHRRTICRTHHEQ